VLTRHRAHAQNECSNKFVEFFGEGTASLTVPDRATIANMAPDYGATWASSRCGRGDHHLLRGTGAPEEIDALQVLLQSPGLDGTVKKGAIDYQPGGRARSRQRHALARRPKRPAGPHRDRQGESEVPELFSKSAAENGLLEETEDLKKRAQTRDGMDIGPGDVMIAAITSCTNTSTRGVLLAAACSPRGGRARPHGQAAREDLARARLPVVPNI